MFERFTDRARRVVVLAHEESRLLGHDYIGTEHILLGLVYENDGVAAKALMNLGVTLEDARTKVEAAVGKGELTTSRDHIPFTPRAKQVLELALREALQLSHNYIGTEHLLLALIREGQGTGMKVLIDLVVDTQSIRREVLYVMNPALIPPPTKQQLVLDCTALELSDRLEQLFDCKREVGDEDPEYQLSLARFLEAAARRLRKSAKTATVD